MGKGTEWNSISFASLGMALCCLSARSSPSSLRPRDHGILRHTPPVFPTLPRLANARPLHGLSHFSCGLAGPLAGGRLLRLSVLTSVYHDNGDRERSSKRAPTETSLNRLEKYASMRIPTPRSLMRSPRVDAVYRAQTDLIGL